MVIINFVIIVELVKFDLISCSAVDNSPLQCSHGKVPVTVINSMKRLSAIAWFELFSKVVFSLLRHW